MPSHGRSRRHDAPSGSPVRQGRRGSKYHSSHYSSSSESRRPRDVPMLSRSSSEVTRSSRSGDSSSHGSRASGIMMNLFGIRTRRDRSSSRSPPPSTFNDDVFIRASVPTYGQRNSAYCSMPPGSDKCPTTSVPMVSGTPFPPSNPLSNIPVPMFYLHPNHQHTPSEQQNHVVGGTYSDGKTHGNHYMSPPVPPSPSPNMPYQAQFASPYYPYPSSNMYPWQQRTEVPGYTMPQPMHRASVPPPQPSYAASADGSRHSTANTVSSWVKSRSAVREEASPTPKSRRRHKKEEDQRQSHRRSADRSRNHSQHRSHSRHSKDESRRGEQRSEAGVSSRRPSSSTVLYQRYSDLSRKLNLHICYGCGRVRSEHFQAANPFDRTKKPLLSFCGKCRGSGGRSSAKEKTEGDGLKAYPKVVSDRATRSRKSSTCDAETRTKHASQPVQDSDESGSISTIREQRHHRRVPSTVSRLHNTRKASQEDLRLPNSYGQASDRASSCHVSPPPMSPTMSSVSTLRHSPGPARGYRPPTVESIVDSDEASSVYKLAIVEEVAEAPAVKAMTPTEDRETDSARSYSCCHKCSQPLGESGDVPLADANESFGSFVSPTTATPENTGISESEPIVQLPPAVTHAPLHASPTPLPRQASIAQEAAKDAKDSKDPKDPKESPLQIPSGSPDYPDTPCRSTRDNAFHISDDIYSTSRQSTSRRPRTFSVHTISPSVAFERLAHSSPLQDDELSPWAYKYVSRVSPSPYQRSQAWSDDQEYPRARLYRSRERLQEEDGYQRAKDWFTDGISSPPIPDHPTMPEDDGHSSDDEAPRVMPPYDFSRLFGTPAEPKENAFAGPSFGQSSTSTFTDADVHALYDQVPGCARTGLGDYGFHGYGGKGFKYVSDEEEEGEGSGVDDFGNDAAGTDDESSLVLWENPIVDDSPDCELQGVASDKGKTTLSDRPRRPSTLEVEECNGSDVDSISGDGSVFCDATMIKMKKYSRMVECEVTCSSDGESDRPRSPVRLRCRASIQTMQVDY